jgi:DNA adenine methylase
VKPFVRYPGSKAGASSDILRYIPRATEYREVFAGSGAVFFALRSTEEPSGCTLFSKEEIEKSLNFQRFWLNDLDQGLMGVYSALRDKPGQFISRVRCIPPGTEDDPRTGPGPRNGRPKNARLKKVFDDMKSLTDEDPLAYLFVNRTAFGSGRVQPDIESRLYFGNEEGWGALLKKDILEECARALRGVRLTHEDYRVPLFEEGDDVVCYVDPPYVVNTGLHKSSQLYRHNFNKEDHIQFAEAIRNCRHKCVISYDDDPFIRDLFPEQDFFVDKLEWRYTGNTQRKIGKELVICNFDPPRMR